jgi:glycosyltransferase involved in cell wall biosynthesis
MARDGRLRVLSLIDLAQDLRGGAERFAIGLATHLPRDRFEPWICGTRELDPGTAARLTEMDIPHLNLARKTKRDVYRMWELAALLRRERIDVIHAHKFGSNLWGTLIGRACGVPVIIAHEHGFQYERQPLRVWLDGRVIGRLATRFVAASATDAERMMDVEHVPPEKVVLMPWSPHLPHLSSGGDLRAELQLGADTPIVAIACVLRPVKAVSVLLEAHARVLARVPEAHLVIAGDGACRAELDRFARELSIDDSVHILGFREDVDSILRAADVGALSSDSEGTPMFIAECMASNLPLVATAVGGVPDLVEDGETGLLVPPRDPGALADGIVRLLMHPEERQRLAAGARRRLADFTIDAVAARFGELYERLAREAGVRS